MMRVYGAQSVLLCRGSLHPQCKMLGNSMTGLSAWEGYMLLKKGKFILDPNDWIIASMHVDFTASVSGEDVSLVENPADVATTFAGGSTPLTAAGGQVKIEAPPRYSGKSDTLALASSPRMGASDHATKLFCSCTWLCPGFVL